MDNSFNPYIVRAFCKCCCNEGIQVHLDLDGMAARRYLLIFFAMPGIFILLRLGRLLNISGRYFGPL